ncbi:MAG TPA: hypothetical protein PKA27_14065 [Fimbriimonadaceae bacterium]|nr:hypothetical protein [Fimbriimonadaceae bacterium]
MEDIERRDRELFISELLRPGRLVGAAAILFVIFLMRNTIPMPWLAIWVGLTVGIYAVRARQEAERRKWIHVRFRTLWEGCQDRLKRFHDVLKQLRKEQVADLQEMPKTIDRVGTSLYAALRRADFITDEVAKTERDLYHAPPILSTLSHDAQAKELYRIADKNIAEYRSQFAGVMAGVQRAEAQAAVYMTTMDSIRMKMIGHRLVGRSPEMSTHDFLEALGEARLQLQAIDQALDELDFSSMPQTITVQPPSIPNDAFDRQRLGGPPPTQ